MKQKVLNWAQQFDTFCFLDNHQYAIQPHTLECILAAGVRDCTLPGPGLSFLQQFFDTKKKSWLFGHLGYDLKNELEQLTSNHDDHIRFPDFFFFEPKILIRLNEQQISIEANQPDEIFKYIESAQLPGKTENNRNEIRINLRIPKEDYISVINRLKQHILRGDCYEINFCQEFYASPAVINPLAIYKKLSEISPNPFSALYRLKDKWLLCASPERFLKKESEKIIAQPIKGTSGRIKNDPVSDEQNKTSLLQSEKDRSENVMIVDLVRNDLSKICREGTVRVDELFGIYSFPQVHQMISTISGELKPGLSFIDMLKATFPMGSMTGAPKRKVMELIENYEKTRRGIFSGALGYISPDGDFDFNVVIRSIMYNSNDNYLSFQTGSAITFHSDPEKEWDECMLKAEAMKKCVTSSQ